MIMQFPHYVKEALEIFGLERSDLEIEGEDLLINCQDFDEAYHVRNKLLEAESHVIIIHLSQTLPNCITVRVEKLLTEQPQT